MDRSSVDRQLNTPEAYWQKNASIGRVPSLAPHPPRCHRCLGPHDENAACALQFLRDQLIEFLSRCDLPVPPDAETLSLDGPNKRFHTPTFRPSVGKEHISHFPTLCLAGQKVKPVLLRRRPSKDGWEAAIWRSATLLRTASGAGIARQQDVI